MKKILSVLLTLAMLLSLVSVSAVAEGEKELLTIIPGRRQHHLCHPFRRRQPG